ncbi:MAG: lytic transglycosylase domain-containing protein [Mariprofundaceae bacterium]
MHLLARLKKIYDRVTHASPKAVLTWVMVIGFLATLPLWLASTPEQKQRLTQATVTKSVIEKSVGSLDILPEEKNRLRRMLAALPDDKLEDFEQLVWMQDMVQLITPLVHGKDEEDAKEIARWVYTYCRRFSLSPELVLALISVESNFDRFAVSNAGARGLMQVMPFWKRELGSDEDNLLHIATNVRYGCAILRIYIDRYGKDLTRALAGYNGSLGKTWYPKRIYARMKKFNASRESIDGAI